MYKVVVNGETLIDGLATRPEIEIEGKDPEYERIAYQVKSDPNVFSSLLSIWDGDERIGSIHGERFWPISKKGVIPAERTSFIGSQEAVSGPPLYRVKWATYTSTSKVYGFILERLS